MSGVSGPKRKHLKLEAATCPVVEPMNLCLPAHRFLPPAVSCWRAYGRFSAASSCVPAGGEIPADLRIQPIIPFTRWRMK
jgi:hypothetical protein